MRRPKRALAEADPNASNATTRRSTRLKTGTGVKYDKELSQVSPKQTSISSASANRSRHRDAEAPQRSSTTIQQTRPPKLEKREDQDEELITITRGKAGEQLNYTTKDNSKLIMFLLDRDLSTSGTREELIARLSTYSIVYEPLDYESLPSSQLTEMLARRGVTNPSLGPKETKIARLRNDDKLDIGGSEDAIQYAQFDVTAMILEEELEKQKALQNGQDAKESYSKLTPGRLTALLEKRKLSQSGSKEVQIARLLKDDIKLNKKRIDKFQKRYEATKKELEDRVGHPVCPADKDSKGFRSRNQAEIHAKDIELQNEAYSHRPHVPICDYDWKNSHWADRTERQLSEICSRREMPGYGPKAAMLKWLDTGNIEYEDMYVGGLEKICRERSIPHKSNEKKVELIRLLREADEASG